MKRGIAFFVLSILLLIAAIVIGTHSDNNSSLTIKRTGTAPMAGELASEAPTEVLPPEQLPQFKNISVYTPKKQDDSNFFINPRDDHLKKSDKAKEIKVGVM